MKKDKIYIIAKMRNMFTYEVYVFSFLVYLFYYARKKIHYFNLMVNEFLLLKENCMKWYV